MAFQFARKEGFPTQYAPNHTPVGVDILDAGLIAASVILGISFFISLPTNRKDQNLSLFTRVSLSLLIGTLLLINNYGQEWEVAHIVSKTPYRAGTVDEINASISIKIGLRSVNVTLRAQPDPKSSLKYEIINYNERFEWTWDQGNFGFGPHAGRLQQEFRAAQYRGLPLPILWIIDYFVIDGEGQRYGRFYRTAGWYTHIIMWAAFACWLLTNLLFRSVIHYGAYILGLCGALQLFANLIYLVVRNPFPLVIPFEDQTLETKFGFNFWCTFVFGIICISLSAVIIFMDFKYDQELYKFFGINPLNSYDELVYLTKEERQQLRPKNPPTRDNDIPLVDLEAFDKDEDDEDVDYVPVYLKRRTVVKAPKISRTNKPSLHLKASSGSQGSSRHQGPLPPPI